MKKINYINIIELEKEIEHPFSRRISIYKIKKEFGKGFVIKYDLGNGLALFSRNFTLNQNILLIEESNIPGACFMFNLGESLSFTYKDNKEYILKKNHFFIELVSNKFYCEVPIKKDEQFITFFIGIKDKLFLKLTDSIVNISLYMEKIVNQNYYILKILEIDTLQSELLNNFKEKKYFEDTLKSIYLESKTTNLLHYSIEKLVEKLNISSSINYDKNRISSLEKAKEIIMKEYDKNLSIKNIAYRVATNQSYLKKDFKEYYGITIYEMLQKRRLEIAKRLLQEDYVVKEVVFKVGYKHLGNFSKIFSNHFGISPSKYKKSIHKK